MLLYGVTGSGKSTAAIAIGERLGLPVHLVDDEFGWLPGWQQRPVAEMRELAGSAAAEPAWVFDTAYAAFRDLVEPHAEVVIGLDYPRRISLSRLLRRTLVRVVARRKVCNGNVETLRRALSSDSIIVWQFRSFARKRDVVRQWAADVDGPSVLLLSHPRELADVLDAL